MAMKVKCSVCGKELDIRGVRMHMEKMHKDAQISTPENNALLEDALKLKADISTKDARIASLEDANNQFEAQFANLHDEIANLNKMNNELDSAEHDREILSYWAHKMDKEAYERLGQERQFIPKPQPATVEDSTQDRAEAARDAHNVEAVGSIPTPATIAPAPVQTAPVTTDNNEKTSKLEDTGKAPDEYIFIGEKIHPGWTYYKDMGFSLKDK